MKFLEKVGLKKPTPIVLSESTRKDWPSQLIEHHGLHKKHARFTKDLHKKIETLKSRAKELQDKKKLEQVPERAQHLSEQHAKTINDHAEKLTEAITFSDVLSFQEELEKALEKVGKFREHTGKNASALREYYEEELKGLATAVQELEDYLIQNGESLDTQLTQILNIKNRIRKLEEEKTKQRKYEKTLNSYLEKRDTNEQNQQKHLKRIEEQKQLVRENSSLEALERIKEIENEIHDILSKYSRLIFDTKHYLLKNNLTPTQESREIFSQLKKDPKGIIRRDHKKLKQEFKELHETITQLEKDDNKNVTERLEKATKEISEDARKIESDEPQLHELKKQVMHDIAALNIYEQEQFLLRNAQEEAEIKERIEVISETLDELRVEQYQEELENTIKELGAIVRHDEQ